VLRAALVPAARRAFDQAIFLDTLRFGVEDILQRTNKVARPNKSG
jgi:hypothetical protein